MTAKASANWFIAYPVDGAFASAIASPPAGFQCFHVDDLHITLAFLGSCGEFRAQGALSALDHMLGSRAVTALDVSLGEVEAFGNKQRYSALSAVLNEGNAKCCADIASLRDPLFDAARVPRETRPARAHITLARPTRRATEQERLQGLAWAKGLDLRGVRLRLASIALYTWDAEREERLFHIVARRYLA